MDNSFKKYDVVGYRIVSPFHLMAFFSYCLALGSDKESLNVLVVFSKGPWGRQVAKQIEGALGRLNVDYVLEDDLPVDVSPLMPLFIALKPVLRFFFERQLVICSPSFACLRLSASSFQMSGISVPVLIDEGIGSYNFLHTVKNEVKEKFGTGVLSKLIFSLFKVVNKGFHVFGGERYQLFNYYEMSLHKNEVVADSYKKTLTLLANKMPEVQLEDRVIVFLSQPFVEMGLCSKEEYLEVLMQILAFGKRSGKTVTVKPHPAESALQYECLGFSVLRYEGAVEEIFARYGHSIVEVWGFISTALITANAVFNIPAKRIISEIDGIIEIPEDSGAAELFEKYTSKLYLDEVCVSPRTGS